MGSDVTESVAVEGKNVIILCIGVGKVIPGPCGSWTEIGLYCVKEREETSLGLLV